MTAAIQKPEEKSLAPAMNAPAPPPVPPIAPIQNQSPPQQVLNAPSQVANNQPTMQDFINEARKLGLQEYEAFGNQLKTQANTAGDIVARKVYGQNVSSESGIGKEVVTKALTPILDVQAAKGNEIAARLSQTALDRYFSNQSAQTAKTDSKDSNRLSTLLNLTSSGQYTPTDDDKAFLAAQGFGGQISNDAQMAQQKFQQDIQNKYGINPATGKAYTSEQEALDVISQQGFDRELAQKFGVNPLTGKPFTSENEAVIAANQTRFLQDLQNKYGMNPTTGRPFASEQEALNYVDSQGFDRDMARKYGFDPATGRPYTSEQAAIEAIDQRSFKQKLKNKFGLNSATGQEYASEQEALDALEQQGFNRELTQKFGVKENGQPYRSEKEAEDDWNRRSGNGEMVRKFGLDPRTGRPFNSESEAALYWVGQENNQNLTLDQQKIIQNRTAKYGLKPDGTAFNSDMEADTYQTQQQINAKYGKRADGSSFGSEEEAIQNWNKKDFDQKLIQKYGVSPSGMPWPSEQAAQDYFTRQGADASLLQKYGTDASGRPYKSESDAIRGENEKQLTELKRNISNPAIRDNIGSIEEFNFYMENGKTYEDDVADIIQSSTDLQKFKDRLPELNRALSSRSNDIENEIAKGGSKDQMKLDHWIEQRDLIRSMINDINAGKMPVVADEEWQGPSSKSTSTPVREILGYSQDGAPLYDLTGWTYAGMGDRQGPAAGKQVYRRR